MAINLGNVKVTDLSQNAHKVLGIGINRASNSNGPFSVNFTTLTQAKDNLTNLILTRKGERLSQPDFGCDIWKILFEPIINNEIDLKVESTILDAVSIWLPYIQINEIFLDYKPEDVDRNGFTVEINFSLSSNANLTESVTLNINN